LKPYGKNIGDTLDANEMGRIKGLIESADVMGAPLKRKIKNFSGVLLLAINYGVVGFGKALCCWISHKPKETFHAYLISD